MLGTFSVPSFMCKDVWVELCLDGSYPLQNGQTIDVKDKGYRLGEVVDKVFYINNTESDIRIVAEQFRQDISFVNESGEPLADHWPMVTTFSYHDYDPMVDDALTDNVEMKDVFLRNKATGMFITIGGTWATHAMQGTYGMPMTISQTASGNCMIMSTSGGLGTNGFMDRPEAEAKVWTMAKHNNGSYVFSYVDGNGTRRALTANDPFVFDWGSQAYHQPVTQYVTTDLPSQSIFNMEDPYQQWEILTKADLLAEARNATSSNPYNLTFLLPGANFNRADSQNSQWRQTFSDGGRSWANIATDGYAAGNEYGNFIGEVYMKECGEDHSKIWKPCRHYATWDVYQEIDVPNGTYNVSCQAFCRPEGGSPTVKFYANGAETNVAQLTSDLTTIPANAISAAPKNMSEAALVFNGGQYGLTLNNIVVTDGKLKIGIKKTSNSGKDDKPWTCFDNFQIQCVGITPTAYETAHATARSLAATSLAAAAAVGDYPYEMEAAIDEEYDVATATAVLDNAITMANNNDSATPLLANADFSQGSEGNPVRPKGWNFAFNPKDGVTPDTDFNVNDGVFNMWTTSIAWSELNQELRNLPNGTYKISADFKTWKSEYLKGDGSNSSDGYSWIAFFGAPADGNVSRADNIVGSVTTEGWTDGEFERYTFYVNVPNHSLTVGVRNDVTRFYQIKNVQVEMVNAEACQAEVAKGCIYQDLCWMDHNALEFDLTAAKYAAAQEVDVRTGGFVQQPNALIRANVGTVAGDNIIVGGMCDNLVLTDKAPFSNSTAFTATAASYERAMASEWGTVMLPYAVASDESVQFYALKKVVEGADGYMSFVEVETLEANTPGVFVKKDANAGSVTLSGGNVEVAATPSALAAAPGIGDAEGWTLNGVFASKVFEDVTQETGEFYYISSDHFWHATGRLTVSPFRAYFTTATAAAAKSFRLVTEADDATEVKLVPEAAPGRQEVYTSGGIRLADAKHLKPGLYIINNKKVIIR